MTLEDFVRYFDFELDRNVDDEGDTCYLLYDDSDDIIDG